jgi:NADH dehydrogenase [ubiquinone] 1 alpha subcomplex assembly factor 7
VRGAIDPNRMQRTARRCKSLSNNALEIVNNRRINGCISIINTRNYGGSFVTQTKDPYKDLSPEQRALLEKLKKKRKEASKTFSVDPSGLLTPDKQVLPPVDPHKRIGKEPLTPLAEDLYSLINFKGPISIHEFMAQQLNHSIHGYYQQNDSLIGQEGDFITSPEISQLFGEMIGIWVYTTWQALGCPPKLDLIELGPGKGTLMVDILKVLSKKADLMKGLEVHFVELSMSLRKTQLASLEKLAGQPAQRPETPKEGKKENAEEQKEKLPPKPVPDSTTFRLPLKNFEIPVTWSSFFQQLPVRNEKENHPSIIIGQEFLDAFPIHQFIYTEEGWREKLVDIDRDTDSIEEILSTHPDDQHDRRYKKMQSPLLPADSPLASGRSSYPYHFRFVRSPGPTAAVQTMITTEQFQLQQRKKQFQQLKEQQQQQQQNKQPKVSFQPTPLQIKRPEENKEPAAPQNPEGLKPGDGFEISPLAIAQCEDIASRIKACRGAALLIDYGEDFVQEDTLRGFKKHKQVHPLSSVSYFTYSLLFLILTDLSLVF